MIVQVAENSAPLAKFKGPIIQNAPVLAQGLVFLELTIFPLLVQMHQKAEVGWKILKPHVTGKNMNDLVPCLVGIGLCFFGGIFPLMIASVEAFRLVGLEGLTKSVSALWDEGQKALEACKKDEKEHEDNSDITQAYSRKLLVIMKAVDPDKVSAALKALIAGKIAVLASLKMNFARALTLGTALGDALKIQVVKYVVPKFIDFVPKEAHRWVPTIVDWACKAVAMFVALSLTSFISGFHSAIRGGRMFGIYGVVYAHRMGWLKDFDPEKSELDEMVGYGLAAFGFVFQIYMGFHLMFPFNLMLLPVRICEGVLSTLVMWV